MNRVAVSPRMLQWARVRSGRGLDDLAGKFPKLLDWEQGLAQPTLKQLENYARATYLPVGYLFLHEPPVEAIPIPDLRTLGGERVRRPSPNLLDTIYLCQRRQAWYRDWARSVGEESHSFFASVRLDSPVEETAARMRTALGFDLEARRDSPTWTDALRQFIAQADQLGVLVMVSGVVGTNNRRKLDPDEFRGFALADDLASLVFINGADTKAAQMFTLAHELAHIWLGESALTDAGPESVPNQRVESWCNRVAAELLVPIEVLRDEAFHDNEPVAERQRLARHFKVSTLVILRRLLDARLISRAAFDEIYPQEVARLGELARGSGGSFYLTHVARVSRRFARALIGSTLEGHTLFRDAYRLLGVRKESTFRELGRSVGYRT